MMTISAETFSESLQAVTTMQQRAGFKGKGKFCLYKWRLPKEVGYVVGNSLQSYNDHHHNYRHHQRNATCDTGLYANYQTPEPCEVCL